MVPHDQCDAVDFGPWDVVGVQVKDEVTHWEAEHQSFFFLLVGTIRFLSHILFDPRRNARRVANTDVFRRAYVTPSVRDRCSRYSVFFSSTFCDLLSHNSSQRKQRRRGGRTTPMVCELTCIVYIGRINLLPPFHRGVSRYGTQVRSAENKTVEFESWRGGGFRERSGFRERNCDGTFCMRRRQ